MDNNLKLNNFILPIAAVLITVAALLWTQRSIEPVRATWEDVEAEAGTGGYRLISTGELQKLIESGSKDILLVDTRQEWEYRSGYIKGAVNFPMEPTWWSRWWKKDDLAAFLGPNKDRFIVFY